MQKTRRLPSKKPIVNQNGDLDIQDFNKPIYLVSEDNKFWEIVLSLEENNTTIARCGKLISKSMESPDGVLRSIKQHPNHDKAKKYILEQICKKRINGYDFISEDNIYLGGEHTELNQDEEGIENKKRRSSLEIIDPEIKKKQKNRRREVDLSDMEPSKPAQEIAIYSDTYFKNFSGNYLEKKRANNEVAFYQLQIFENYLKLEEGIEFGDNPSVDLRQFKSNSEARSEGLKLIAHKLAEGFVINESKFNYTFLEEDLKELKSGSLSLANAGSHQGSRSDTRGGKNERHNKHSPARGDYRIELEEDAPEVSENSNSRVFQFYSKKKNGERSPSPSPIGRTNMSSRIDNEENSRGNFLSIPGDNRNNGRSKSPGGYSETSMRSNFSELTDEYSRSRSPSQNRSRSVSPLPNESNILGSPCSEPITVMLAETWEEEVDPSGYFMSEKLDGVRSFWSGTKLYSRNKLSFYPPSFFTRNWPKCQMDGELWLGRNMFQSTVRVVKRQTPVEEDWKKVVFMVFDAPGVHLPFDKRYDGLKEVIEKSNNPYLRLVQHDKCKSKEHLLKELEKVEKNEGEGIMLRDPKSYYENRRSKALLKVKTFKDAEAQIIGHEKATTGQFAGLIGAFRVKNKDGVEFKVGSGLNLDDRRKPPKIGTWITYKYQGLSESGKPRFPTYWRDYNKV